MYVEIPAPTPSFGAGVFGPGTDGNVTYSAPTTITTDVNADNITINTNIVLTIGWNAVEGRPARLKANGTLTLGSGSKIVADGLLSAHPAGGLAGAGGTGVGGAGTVASGTGAAGSAGVAVVGPSLGGTGGAGSSSFPAATFLGGSGGTIGVVTPSYADLLAGTFSGSAFVGGSGGGGGGRLGTGSGAISASSGGSGGGGVIYIAARHIVIAASPVTLPVISARGGRAQLDAGANGAGGIGGPGGGGAVVLICEDIDSRVATDTRAGAVLGDASPVIHTSGVSGYTYLAAFSPNLDVAQGYFRPIVVTP